MSCDCGAEGNGGPDSSSKTRTFRGTGSRRGRSLELLLLATLRILGSECVATSMLICSHAFALHHNSKIELGLKLLEVGWCFTCVLASMGVIFDVLT